MFLYIYWMRIYGQALYIQAISPPGLADEPPEPKKTKSGIKPLNVILMFR